MGSLTHGVVKYERTLNLGDYNSKKAGAEIAFSAAEDGSDFDHWHDQAATKAISKVHDLLALAQPAARVATPAPAPAVAAGPKVARSKSIEDANAGKTKADLAAAAGAPKAEPKKEPEPAKPAATDTAEDMGDEDFSGTAEEITDQQLMEAVRDMAAKVTPAPVKKLIAAYGCVAPKTVRDIAADKRQAFLTELKNLKA